MNYNPNTPRFDEWSNIPDPVSLRREIALMRFTASKAIDNPTLCATLCAQIAKLVHVDRVEAQRRGALLTPDFMARAGPAMAEVMTTILQRRLPETKFIESIDLVRPRINEVVEREAIAAGLP